MHVCTAHVLAVYLVLMFAVCVLTRIGICIYLESPGLPEYKYPSLDQTDIMAEVAKKYPDFEKRTGWRFESAYTKEIPEDLAKEVQRHKPPDAFCVLCLP